MAVKLSFALHFSVPLAAVGGQVKVADASTGTITGPASTGTITEG